MKLFRKRIGYLGFGNILYILHNSQGEIPENGFGVRYEAFELSWKKKPIFSIVNNIFYNDNSLF